MNVVDSSGWLEYFADGANAGFFAPTIEASAELLVPALALFEVFKRVAQQRGEAAALQAIGLMQQARVIALDASLAVEAARVSLLHRLPMADSVILATARTYGAELWTQDRDLAGLDGVRYQARVS